MIKKMIKKEHIFDTFARLATKDNFALLHYEMRMGEAFKDFVSHLNSCNIKVMPKEGSKYKYYNVLKLNKNESIKLNNQSANLIYMLIKNKIREKYSPTLYEISCEDDGTLNNEKFHLDYIIEKILGTIKTISEDPFYSLLKTNEKVYVKILNQCIKMQGFSYYLTKNIAILYLKNQRKSGGKMFVTRSKLCNHLGVSCLTFILKSNKRLSHIYDLLQQNTFEKLSEDDIMFLKNMMDAMWSKDYVKLNQLFSEINDTSDPFFNDSSIQKVFSLYLKNLVFILKTKYPEEFRLVFSMKNSTESFIYKESFEEAFKKNITKVTQLGDLIVDICILHKLLIEKKENINGSKYSTNTIEIFNIKLMESLLDIYAHNKPHLAPYPYKIRDYLRFKNDNPECTKLNYDSMFEITENFKMKKIHGNQNMSLRAEEDILNVATPRKKYTIDVVVLQEFLIELETISLPIFEESISYFSRVKHLITTPGIKESLENIMVFYEFTLESFEKLFHLYDETNDAFYKTIYLLIEHMVTFNNSSFKHIKETMIKPKTKDKNKDTGYTTLKHYANKIEQYKYFLIGLLRDAIIYSRFNYFVAHSFLDTRGRLYNSETFLNIQNYPKSKTFVKLYIPNDLKHLRGPSWYFIKKLIKEEFEASNLNEFKRINLRKAKQENRELTRKYLYSFFDSDKVSFDSFKKIFNNTITLSTKELLCFIKKNIKKKYLKKIWIIFGRMRNPLENLVEYDASNSGAQMIAILFKNRDLAEQSNLIGKIDYDMYAKALEALQILLTRLKIIRNHYGTCGPEFFTMDLSISKNISLILKNIEDKKIFLKRGILALCIKYSYIIPTVEYKLFESLEKDNETKNIFLSVLMLRAANKIGDYAKNNIWLEEKSSFWNDRDLFKKPIMTLAYNATRYTRIKHFDDFIKKKCEFFTGSLPSNPKEFSYLSHFLEAFFLNYSRVNLKGTEKMKLLTKALVKRYNELKSEETEESKQIAIINDFFTLIFHPTHFKSYQVDSTNYLIKRKQLSVLIPDDVLDLIALIRIFSPNLIHSMDAYIVQNYIRIMGKFNDQLNEKNLMYNIGFYTNHDNFACTIPVILYLVIKEAYLKLIDFDYILHILPKLDLSKKANKIFHGKDKEEFKRDFIKESHEGFIK